MAKVLVTGAAGFLGGYVVRQLLDEGHQVIGLDDHSKYGPRALPFENDPNFSFVEGDAKNTDVLMYTICDCDYLIALAARVGGIGYVHQNAYDLFAENERISISTLDAAIRARRNRKLRRAVLISSSMVYENATVFPTPEDAVCLPPTTSYGFQKLSLERLAQAAGEQYGLPYVLVRPFNCVGAGELKSKIDPGVEMVMGHVIPDLIRKVALGQDPLHILGSGYQLRNYTYGSDLARGIVRCMEHPGAAYRAVNISSPWPTSVLDLAEKIWKRVRPLAGKPRIVHDPAMAHDVLQNTPDLSFAGSLGISCPVRIDQVLDEMVPWVLKQMEEGRI